MSTFLQLTNEVLIRLRESQVSTINETAYSTLISRFVNEAKRQVEDSWSWKALDTTLTLTLTPGTYEYSLVGSGRRFKDIEVNDSTSLAKLSSVSEKWVLDQYQLSTVQSGDPVYYAWSGWDGADSKVYIFPTPNRANVLKFNLNIPQADLVSDDTVLLIPADPVIAGAYARALVERGEDGGLQSSESYLLYKGILSDYIALEQTRLPEWDTFGAV
jgi:hypothetical protein